MIDLLVHVLIVALILGVVFWAVTLLPLPHPFGLILRVVLAVVAIIWLINLLLGSGGFRLG